MGTKRLAEHRDHGIIDFDRDGARVSALVFSLGIILEKGGRSFRTHLAGTVSVESCSVGRE